MHPTPPVQRYIMQNNAKIYNNKLWTEHDAQRTSLQIHGKWFRFIPQWKFVFFYKWNILDFNYSFIEEHKLIVFAKLKKRQINWHNKSIFTPKTRINAVNVYITYYHTLSFEHYFNIFLIVSTRVNILQHFLKNWFVVIYCCTTKVSSNNNECKIFAPYDFVQWAPYNNYLLYCAMSAI